jgi:hypothetical protein
MYAMEEWAYRVRYTLRGFVRALRSRFSVERLSGPLQRTDHLASIVVAGRRPGGGYPASLIFAGSPGRSLLARVPLWALPRTLEQLTRSVDLLIARVDPLSARMLFGGNYLHTPAWVTPYLHIPQDLSLLTTGKHRKSLRNDLNRAARNGLRCQLSHSETDLAEFYHNFYVPYARQRFGEHASFVSFQLLRRRFKHGGLFWALRDGERVAGATFVHGRTLLRFEALGAAHGDPRPVGQGAFTALYWALIQHAGALGCKEVSFGPSSSVLTAGTLRYKRKFGARIVDGGYSDRRLLRWQELNPTVLALLATAPLVFEERGHPSAVTVLDTATPASQDDVTQAYRFLHMSGLHRIHLLSGAGFQEDVTAPPQACLTDLNTLGRENLAVLLSSGALGRRST